MSTLADILRDIYERRGITRSQLFSAHRHKLIARARQELYWRAHNELGMNYSAIGRRIGRDHTTVLHGIRAHAERLAQAELANTLRMGDGNGAGY